LISPFTPVHPPHLIVLLTNDSWQNSNGQEELKTIGNHLEAFKVKFNQVPEQSQVKFKQEYDVDLDRMLVRYWELNKSCLELQVQVKDLE
jgi:hypothetical protein